MPRIRSESPAFDLHHPELSGSHAHSGGTTLLEEIYGQSDISEHDPEGH
jgi:hypothetical protein